MLFRSSGVSTNTIDYITIASLGNAVNFGQLTTARGYGAGMASATRGVFAGGLTAYPAGVNTIDYITIASLGNAINFGSASSAIGGSFGCSNGHGGLG